MIRFAAIETPTIALGHTKARQSWMVQNTLLPPRRTMSPSFPDYPPTLIFLKRPTIDIFDLDFDSNLMIPNPLDDNDRNDMEIKLLPRFVALNIENAPTMEQQRVPLPSLEEVTNYNTTTHSNTSIVENAPEIPIPEISLPCEMLSSLTLQIVSQSLIVCGKGRETV